MVLFDSHVHIYNCFDLDIFFAKAFENFQAAASGLNEETENRICFLLLTESKGYNYFARLQALAGDSETGTGKRSWQVFETKEQQSLLITHEDYSGISLFVVAGRQLVTAERLELLALCTESKIQDGLELDHAVEAVIECGGIAVCPWGAGKWLGSRGTVLEKRLHHPGSSPLFAGDSGGRPLFWPTPGPIKLAKNKKSPILSGTDPLPLIGEERRVGSFGGSIAGDNSLDIQAPGASLKSLLLDPETDVQPFGRLQNPLLFVKNQLNLRLADNE